MHDRTDGPAGNCIARIGQTRNRWPSSSSLRLLCSVVCRVRAPMSSFLPTYDRQPATCPCRILSARLPVPPSVRQAPDATLHASGRAKWRRLCPENARKWRRIRSRRISKGTASLIRPGTINLGESETVCNALRKPLLGTIRLDCPCGAFLPYVQLVRLRRLARCVSGSFATVGGRYIAKFPGHGQVACESTNRQTCSSPLITGCHGPKRPVQVGVLGPGNMRTYSETVGILGKNVACVDGEGYVSVRIHCIYPSRQGGRLTAIPVCGDGDFLDDQSIVG